MPKVQINIDEVMQSVQEDNMEGICVSCGEFTDRVEPDAEGYECNCCGELTVMGCENYLLMYG